MAIKMITLSENTAKLGYLAEWGLSIYIEIDGTRVLFDTGAGISAINNAQIARVDLSSVDKIVLSHGHYDHTGGLRDVLKRAGRKEVIAHPGVWGRKYKGVGTGQEQYIGIPFARDELEALSASFILSSEPVKISERVTTTGEVPMVTAYESIETDLFVKDDDGISPDAFPDDLSLVIETEFGLVVVLGCAHRGMVNTLLHARKITGNELVYAVIGGTHLINASRERLERTAADLKGMGVQYIGVSHCTGFNASAYLAGEFGDSFFLNNAGNSLSLPFS